MTTPNLILDLKIAEGLRFKAYPDPLSGGAPWTIGYGHTGPDVEPHTVWTQAQADAALAADIAKAVHGLDTQLAWWRGLDDARQDVLVNMAFNLGLHGLLTFHATLAAIERRDFEAASADMLASAWAHQVGPRAARLARQMLTGREAA